MTDRSGAILIGKRADGSAVYVGPDNEHYAYVWEVDHLVERRAATLAERAKTLADRMSDLTQRAARVANGGYDSVNSLGEVQGQGGQVDVACAELAAALAERDLVFRLLVRVLETE